MHLLAHYHDNYFDVVRAYLNQEEAIQSYHSKHQENAEEVEESKRCNGTPFANLQTSRYFCEVAELEQREYFNNERAFVERPDKGSAWGLLLSVPIEGWSAEPSAAASS